MSGYFTRLTQFVLALVALTIVGHAQAHATYAYVKIIKKVKGGTNNKGGTDKAFRFEITSLYNGRPGSSKSVILRPTDGEAKSEWITLLAGKVTITESLLTGVSLESVSCEREHWQNGKPAGKINLSSIDKGRGEFKFKTWYNDYIKCTVTNVIDKPTPPTLIVKKISNGKTGTFSFSGRGAAGTFPGVSLQTRTVGQPVATQAITLGAGALTITEAAATDFKFVGANCNVGRKRIVTAVKLTPRTVRLTMPKTGQVVCTFTNTYVPPPVKPPTIVVRKVTQGGTGKFTFSGSGTAGSFGNRVLTTTRADAPVETLDIPLKKGGGSLTIKEEKADGFVLAGVKCVAGNNPLNTNVNPIKGTAKVWIPNTGQVICTFTNEYIPPDGPPTIIVKKITTGGIGTFKFSAKGADTFTRSLTTTKAGVAAMTPVITLAKGGALTIAEAPAANFTLSSAVCKSGRTPVSSFNSVKRSVTAVIPATGEVVCTFTNTYVPPAKPPIVIVKKITQGGVGTFSFTGSGVGTFTKSVTTVKAGEEAATAKIVLKRAGRLTITEAAADNFVLIDAVCKSGTTTVSSFNPAGRSVTAAVPADSEVVCTFTNKYIPPPEPPTIIVRKITQGGVGTFTFKGAGAAGSFTRSVTTRTKNVGVRAPEVKLTGAGDLTITEGEVKGYTLTAVACTIQVKGGTIRTLPIRGPDFAQRKVSLTVPKTGQVVCTFTNKYTKPPTIVVRKITQGGVGTFTFSGTGPAGKFQDVSITTVVAGEAAEAEIPITLTPGELTITEAEVNGYRLIAASCQIDKQDLRARINKRRRFIKINVPKTGQIVCTFTNSKGGGTVTIISNFLKRRAELLTGDTGRPRLIERRRDRYARSSLKDSWGIDGQGTEREGRIGYRTSLSKLGGSLRESTSDKAARLGVDASQYGGWDEPAYRGGWDIWSEGSWSYFKSDGGSAGGTASTGQFGLIRGGIDYLVQPNLLVGVLVQYDYLRERAETDAAAQASEAGFDISGHGWMAGPYVEYELTQNLFFDVKGLVGTSLNQVSPYGTYSDEFTTTRWLVAARLTGSWRWQDSERSLWHFSPRAEVVWFNEESEDFIDSEGYLVAGQQVHLGRFKAGPELSYRYMTHAGTIIEPRVAAQALWSFSRSGDAKGGGLDPASVSGVKDVPLETFQMRFEAGLKIEDEHGQRLEVEANYTGLGQQGHQAVGGKVGVTIPLQSKSAPQ